jgi:hypothetical protein
MKRMSKTACLATLALGLGSGAKAQTVAPVVPKPLPPVSTSKTSTHPTTASGTSTSKPRSATSTATPKRNTSGSGNSPSRPAGTGERSPSATGREGQPPSTGLSNMYKTGGGSVSNSPGSGGVSISLGSSTTETALPEPESKVLLLKINQTRVQFTGSNQRPLPDGNVVQHANGNATVITRDGRHIDFRSNATIAGVQSKNVSATFFANERMASLHSSLMDVQTGPRGERTIVVRRSDQSVLVRTGPHSGYLERPVTLPDKRQIVMRTYVRKGAVFTQTYTPYVFHGVTLLHYVPQQYFGPGMYGWAYYQWKPMPFRFNAGGIPAPAGGPAYFTPSGSYSSGYSWLSDYDLSDMMQKFSDMQAAEGSQANDPGQDQPSQDPATQDQPPLPQLENHVYSNADVPINPTIKDAIADEIRQQLAVANIAASGKDEAKNADLPEALQLDHVFVVSALLEVNARDDQTCSLSAGDVLQLAAPLGANDTEAQTRVASSHRSDCPAGEIVGVSLQELQQMQNDLRAEMEEGLRALRDNQGKDGWPQAPASALAAPHPAFDGLPTADPQVSDLVEAQKDEVAKAEAAVKASAYAKN